MRRPGFDNGKKASNVDGDSAGARPNGTAATSGEANARILRSTAVPTEEKRNAERLVVETRDRRLLSALLGRNRAEAVYFIADLESPYFEECRWFVSQDEEDGRRGLVLLFGHSAGPALLTFGPANKVDDILRSMRADFPGRVHAHLPPDHIAVFEQHYVLAEGAIYLRMKMERHSWNCDHMAPGSPTPVRLAEEEGPEVKRFLDTYLPGNFFAPCDLASNCYFGIYDGASLLSVAGAHAVSPNFRLAAIGNIATRSDCRRRGLASGCVCRLLKELFKMVDLVALNVQHTNFAAITLYEQLGFSQYGQLLLASCSRR
jgi:GNAT superfamily N-acetyltransferase